MGGCADGDNICTSAESLPAVVIPCSTIRSRPSDTNLHTVGGGLVPSQVPMRGYRADQRGSFLFGPMLATAGRSFGRVILRPGLAARLLARAEPV